MSGPKRKRVAVLISGRGSNLQALIEAAAAPDYPAEIKLVVASVAAAGGLVLAKQANIPTVIVTPGRGSERATAEAALQAELEAAGIEIVCLAGYMHILSADFVERWRDQLINIHPSLLPSFKGLDTHRRALESGVRLHGCTVHYVRAAVDDGPAIAQAAVRVYPDDTPDTLAARVLGAEHRLYPAALAAALGGADAENVLAVGGGDQDDEIFMSPGSPTPDAP